MKEKLLQAIPQNYEESQETKQLYAKKLDNLEETDNS